MEMAGTTIRDALREHAMELAAEVWPDKPVLHQVDGEAIVGRPWYIIETEPQRETTAAAHMMGRGFAPYLPMVMTRGVRAGRGVRDVTRPMFRGYLFLRMLFGLEYDRIRNLPGVRGVLKKAGNNENNFAHPTDRDIEFIKSQEKEALDPGAAKAARLAPYTVGRTARVIEGPFGGFTGKIWQLADDERITILLDIFGRSTPVKVERAQLDPL